MVDLNHISSEQDLLRHARAMARALPRHVGVLLLDSGKRLVSSMLFPVAPDPATLMAGLYASRTARVALYIFRPDPITSHTADRLLAVRLLDGARFFGIPIDALVVSPTSHQVLMRSEEPPQ